MESNNLIKGLELVLQSVQDLKPKDISVEDSKKVDEAILKGSKDLEKLKSTLKNMQKDIKL